MQLFDDSVLRTSDYASQSESNYHFLKRPARCVRRS